MENSRVHQRGKSTLGGISSKRNEPGSIDEYPSSERLVKYDEMEVCVQGGITRAHEEAICE
jgi:hypothetical protein